MDLYKLGQWGEKSTFLVPIFISFHFLLISYNFLSFLFLLIWLLRKSGQHLLERTFQLCFLLLTTNYCCNLHNTVSSKHLNLEVVYFFLKFILKIQVTEMSHLQFHSPHGCSAHCWTRPQPRCQQLHLGHLLILSQIIIRDLRSELMPSEMLASRVVVSSITPQWQCHKLPFQK